MSEICNQESYRDCAIELFKQGYNCSQAVFAAFYEECGVDFETALKISSSFGGGMGRLREVCGAVSGMFMAAGMKYGYSDPKDAESKIEHYKRIQELAQEFKEKNGSIVCRELLGLSVKSENHIPEERTDEYYKKRPCAELVGDAAEIMYEYMKTNRIERL
ncbi:MAG: C-GCAxxG-C-C family protein [Clostridiaceae bacterium]